MHRCGLIGRCALLLVLSACASAPSRQPGAQFRDCPDCPVMVVVPAGSFDMGGSDAEHQRERIPETMAATESPVHRVTIAKALAVGRFEVTVGEFRAFRATQPPSDAAAGCNVIDPASGKWNNVPARSWRDPGFRQTDRHPVVCVSWNDAQAYAGWLSAKTGHRYRLLSESEWEFVARAGATTARFWGDGRDDACRHASVADLTRAAVHRVPTPTPDLVFQCHDGFVQTAPVGRFSANAFGLYDVNGNVWEWTSDCLNPSYQGAPADGTPRRDGDCSKHMDRGGSWVNSPKYLRLAVRHADVTGIRNDVLGMRVARELD